MYIKEYAWVKIIWITFTARMDEIGYNYNNNRRVSQHFVFVWHV